MPLCWRPLDRCCGRSEEKDAALPDSITQAERSERVPEPRLGPAGAACGAQGWAGSRGHSTFQALSRTACGHPEAGRASPLTKASFTGTAWQCFSVTKDTKW